MTSRSGQEIRKTLCFAAVWIVLIAPWGQAELGYRATLTLPFSGGVPQLHGDLVPNDTGMAAVYSRPEEGGRLGLMFYRFGADLTVAVERPVAPEVVNHYEPALCWDGQNYAVVSSTFNQATFMILSPAGEIVLAPLQLPGPPAGEGWRTAAFRVLWTGNAYAVFGILAEPEYPGQAQGSYYTHLTYWLVNNAGEVLAQKDLGSVTPLAYPSFEGAEKEYYDVVWTGAAFFLAYQSESAGIPPVFQIAYRMVDLQGNPVRAEAPATTLPTKGPHLDTNGAAIGLASLRQEAFPGGNLLYARFFSLDGTPLGAEVRYDNTSDVPTGYAPQIFTYRGRFIATYVYADPYSIPLEYFLKFAEFDGAGNLVRAACSVADPLDIFLGTMNLGVDLQLVSLGRRIFGKGQTGLITGTPILFLIEDDTQITYRNLFELAHQWQAPYDFTDLNNLIEDLRE